MTRLAGITRNVTAGLVIAFTLAFSSASLHASCGANHYCTEGDLMGIIIECYCAGDGSCIEHGSTITCACDGYETENCGCYTGCN